MKEGKVIYDEELGKEFYHMSIDETRELNQTNLETFLVNKENLFESNSNQAIDKLLERKKKNDHIISKLDRSSVEIEIQAEISEYSVDNYYIDEELYVLYELKIIYLYKFLEINLKKVLAISFNIDKSTRMYQWDHFGRLLQEREIDIKSITNYREVNELRQVNNSLKHSDAIEENLIRKITEFRESDDHPFLDEGKLITYRELELFYNRIKDSPVKFLEDLVSKVYDYLYVFDEKKLTRMADKIALRMEEKDAKKLIEKLKSIYQ